MSAKVPIHPGSPSSGHSGHFLPDTNYSSSLILSPLSKNAFNLSRTNMGWVLSKINITPSKIKADSTFFPSLLPFNLSANGKKINFVFVKF